MRLGRKGIAVAILPAVAGPAERRSLVPRYAVIATALVVLLAGAGVAAALLVTDSRLVDVPVVTDLPQARAEVALSQRSLGAAISGQVSVDVPPGQVISQDPPPGARVEAGSTVTLIVSVGPQTITVPDLVGEPLEAAREELSGLGLEVEVATASSEVTSTVVLEMYPAPGAVVSAGDSVRLTIPGTAPSTTALLPYDLDGLAVALDPVPVRNADEPDAAMDVARRLRALLEASGATVVVTRTATDTAPTPPTRLDVARNSGARVLVGIDLGHGGIPGLTVLRLADQADDPARTEESRLLAQSITRAARMPGLMVNEPSPSSDSVLFGFPGMGVRVVLADVSAQADMARLNDPEWADQVARAIYRGIGTELGSE